MREDKYGGMMVFWDDNWGGKILRVGESEGERILRVGGEEKELYISTIICESALVVNIFMYCTHHRTYYI